MSPVWLRTALLSMLLALGLTLTACDDSPPWTGTWALDDGTEQTDIDYWHITPEEVIVIADLTDVPETDLQCGQGAWDITAVEDDVIRLLVGDELDVSYRLKRENGTLHATELGDDENYIQDEISFEAVEELPFDLEDCAEIQW